MFLMLGGPVNQLVIIPSSHLIMYFQQNSLVYVSAYPLSYMCLIFFTFFDTYRYEFSLSFPLKREFA